ncbi:MAG: helix-turn-helix domain-containing protein [Bacteroidia bacterium]
MRNKDTLLEISFKEEVKYDGFESLSLSDLIAIPKDHDPYQPHRISFYTLILITEGRVDHMLDYEHYPLEKNDCLIISKNQVHAFDPNANYVGYAFLFTDHYLENNLSRPAYFKVLGLFNYHLSQSKHRANSTTLDSLHHLIVECEKSDYEYKSSIIASLFTVVLLKLCSQSSNQNRFETKSGFDLFQAFKMLVENGYNKSRNVNYHVEKLGISHKYLNEICKRFTGKTAKEFLDHYVVLEIKRKLSATSNVNGICYECGFSEPSNFHKYFKKQTGQSIMEFRKSMFG